MPWPVYLAFKHLFPTGRRAAGASARRVLLLAVSISTVIFVGMLVVLWQNGALGRLHAYKYTGLGSMLGHLGLVWVWLTLAAAFVALIFRLTPFFNAMSIMGIVLGVTVLITVQSVMNGFSHEYEKVFILAQGNLDIWAKEPIRNPREVVSLIKQVPGVKLAEPVTFGQVMLIYQDNPLVPKVRSFDMNSPDAARNPLAQSVGLGRFEDLDDKSVLLGRGIYSQLGSPPLGSKVDIYTPLMVARMKKDDVLMPKELEVAGVFETGWTGVDDTTIAVTLRTMQDLYGFNDEAHTIEVRLDNDDLAHTRALAEIIQQKLQPLNDERVAAGGPDAKMSVYTWEEMNKDQLQILFVEKTVMFYIMIVIVVVAAFCILCSLATSVVRKTREVGVLGVLGAQPPQVAAIFCLQGLFIGVVGTVVGIGLSLILLYYRQDIVEAFVDQRQLIEFYKFYSFPVQYRLTDFEEILGFTFFISTLAGALPAWWAARLKPADCLRYE